MQKKKYKIVGIDPGYDRCGVASIYSLGPGLEEYHKSFYIQTSSKEAYLDRLKEILNVVGNFLDTEKPDFLAIEDLFFNSNQKTAIKVAQVKGAIIALAVDRDIPVFEYTPLQVKLATTGSGRADKKSVHKLLKQLLKLDDSIKMDDELDAIACALTLSVNELKSFKLQSKDF